MKQEPVEADTTPKAVALPTAEPKNRVPWSPLAAILYTAFVYFAAQFIASLLVIIYPHLRHWNAKTGDLWLKNSIFAQFWYVLFAEALTFGAIVWFVRFMKGNLKIIGLIRPHIRDIGYALLGFMAYFAVYTVAFDAVSHLIPSINLNQKQDTGFQNVVGTGSLIVTFISLVILPPIVEETVFRGFLFSGLKSKLPVVWAALGTSVLFASAHLEFGSGKPLLWVAAIDTFTLSMVLCYLRQKTKGLWAGMLVHALKNSLAFASLFVLHVK